MDEIWMNSLCRGIATQVVNETLNSHREDNQETLNKHFKEITEVLANAKWENLVQEVIKSREDFESILKLCSHCKKEFPRFALSELPIDKSYHGLYCHECYSIMQETCKAICAVCRQKHFYWEGSKYFCATCNTRKNHREILKVQLQNRRAQKKNLANTLTLSQWIETLNYFKWSCAYCRGIYHALEHYNPLPYEGTTQKNCFPSCRKCNGIKTDRLPELFEHLFPLENIRRIKEYQASLS
jgi:5-methylcytosine-specific restriction endonuclease McrA